MDQKLPKLLNYNQLKPVGYPSQIKYMKFTPQSFASSGTNEIIRFNINTSGFWDPYSAYFEIEVDTNDMDPGTLQVDNSAASFINELILNNQGTEIERIQEYDVLAAILNDMAYTQEQRQSKRHEGLGFFMGSNIRNEVFGVRDIVQPSVGYSESGAYIGSYQQQMGWKPWFLSYYKAFGGSVAHNINALQPYGKEIDLTTYPDRITPSDDNLVNSILLGLRYSLGRYDIQHAKIDNSNTLENKYVLNNLNKRDKFTSGFTTDVDTDYDDYIDIKHVGYSQPFTPALSGTSFEPHFSKIFKQSQTFKGKVNQVTAVTKQTFQIPILSGLLGVLMPKESYKYIPMTLLPDLQIELRLNPYAMFTSGYLDDPTITSAASGKAGTGLTETLTTAINAYNQQRRRWKISDISINVELHYFQPAVEQLITDNINSENGIVLHTHSWLLGPIYNIDANNAIQGTYSINLGFESMKTVVIAFLPNDYTQYSFCRKQYRISQNITELQFKIGQEYFPSEKLRGHGGIPRGLESTSTLYGNNSQFLIELYKAFGKFHDITTDCMVNSANFAINDRAYNPDNITSFFTQSGASTNNGTNKFTLNNIDTANGLSLFHENRCVGKALYALNFETLNADLSVISGINTMQSKPFEVVFRSDNINFTDLSSTSVSPSYPRASSMYIFCLYDMLVQIKKSGIMILGRG